MAEARDLLHALRHPVRREILTLLADPRRGPMSPRELSGELGKPIPTTSYHARVLLECDAVEIVDERPVRGTLAHYYAFAVTEPWALQALGVAPEEDDEDLEETEE